MRTLHVSLAVLSALFLSGACVEAAVAEETVATAAAATADANDATPQEKEATNEEENDAGEPAEEDEEEEEDEEQRIVAEMKINLSGKTPHQGTFHPQCQGWAEDGECDANPTFMLERCAASCASNEESNMGHDASEVEGENDVEGEGEGKGEKKLVDEDGNELTDLGPRSEGTAYVRSGEDAAIGAFRFGESYAAHFANDRISNDDVLDIARRLSERLVAADYVPPPEVTHCGSGGDNGKKKRPCSAGKLWKRAEEMRKADMHDAAGADLIRALLKSGIEVDFKEKCEHWLQWSFGSVRKQRERERREAEEEAKLEKRREEERAAMEEAELRRKEYEDFFVTFGTRVQEESSQGAPAAAEATVNADGEAEVVDVEVQNLIQNVKQTFTSSGPQGGNCTETLQLLKKLTPGDKSVDLLLIEARCQEILGEYKLALSAAGRLIAKAASYDSWTNDSPRMMAATLGANAAMQLGLSDNAISFYQTVLKYDPDQSRARKQYKGLKKVVKLLGKAEDQIQKGYNNAAAEHVDECLSAMRGLDVDSPLFRSKIQLKQCTILSGQGKYEEALEHCDVAVELRTEHASVSSASRKEAYLVRAEALLQDMDYDEAVQDLRAALDLVPEDDMSGERHMMNNKLRNAMREQDLWNGGQKDWRYNDETGYPDGRPPQRDHAKILQLPIDLEQRSKEIRCAWLKKQFKALVRKFHPDKYKGNKKRAARKFKEVKDAKEIISKQWDC